MAKSFVRMLVNAGEGFFFSRIDCVHMYFKCMCDEWCTLLLPTLLLIEDISSDYDVPLFAALYRA